MTAAWRGGVAAMLAASTGAAMAEGVADRTGAPTWSQLSMLLGAVVFGVAFMWYAKRVLVPREEFDGLLRVLGEQKATFDRTLAEQRTAADRALMDASRQRDERCNRHERDISSRVVRETYDRDYAETQRELVHRKTTLDNLGKVLTRFDGRTRRLELHVTAIAVKLGVSIEKAEPLIPAEPEDET